MQEPILLVEDDYILQFSLATILRREGYAVDTARNVSEARLALVSRRPRIVLLDLGLPDGSGIDILKACATEPDRPLIIVTTANDSPKAALEALSLGAFDYLTKPINHETLRYTLRRAVSYDQLRQQVREYEQLKTEIEEASITVRKVAHSISQALTAIMGEAQLVRAEVTDASLLSSLDRIVRMAETVAQHVTTIRTLRLFALRESGGESAAEIGYE
ncbi:response regulator [Chloroflexus aggregans]|uniref:Response regulator receiver protein n=1 Tax=Chloroflexus aggregans (strain MD-66 / DSM 9485) TaxID=326427 RepID=B8G9X0_CHLAD|nr:response regulator [Chloroflexus aggregans]ACL24485.1 response regulator receiver protein [Chloroflexus aggregans DSM 9485]